MKSLIVLPVGGRLSRGNGGQICHQNANIFPFKGSKGVHSIPKMFISGVDITVQIRVYHSSMKSKWKNDKLLFALGSFYVVENYK